ncbi:MAG: superoxide dismutase [Bacteroidales bacterium]|nr:superoxide dismutase [Bacteroidales bacterium]
MNHNLPPLPYSPDALGPYISAETISYHYGKHHQTYVNNLNKLLPGSPFENATLEQIICEASGGIFNNGAQVWNHTFYWNCLSPQGGGTPEGELLQALTGSFGSFEQFRERFTQAAATLFGSGWAWLVRKNDGTLDILQTGNAGNPLRDGHIPLMTCDVWEHAYYLDKQNRRPDYIADFWKIVNWQFVAELL